MHGDEAERLAASVLLQAINDAGLRSGTAEDLRSVHPLDRAEAISFLTSPAGEWKRSRDWWCAVANRDPETLRRWSADKLGLPIEAPPAVSSEPVRLFQLVPKPPKTPRNPRGPKLLAVQDMLKRPEGLAVEEVMQRFGWAKSTVLSVLSGDLRRHGFVGRRGEDGRYRLATV